MRVRKSVILLAALTVGACGGGGGGGDTGSGGGGGDGGGGNGDGGSGDPVTVNGAAEIVFPWTHSTATAPTVTIRGIASDPEGVASVLINGVAASITATGTASTQKLFVKGSLEEGEVAWSAEVELSKGVNVLTVAVEDETGNVSEEADTATIKYVEVPITFTLDPERTRLVGLSYTLTASGYEQHLVEHNYDTLEQTIFEGVGTAPEVTCFRPFQNEFLYLSFVTGTRELRKFDLTTGQDQLLVEITNEWNPGPGYRPTPYVARLVCDSNHTNAFVLANYTYEDGTGYDPEHAFAKSRVLEIDLATGLVTLLSESTTSPPWIARDIALAENTIVALRNLDPEAPLTSIALAGGGRTYLTQGMGVGGITLDPHLSSSRVYVATFDGVDEIGLNGTFTKRNISPVDDNHPLAFSQVRSIAFDVANNRVIVGDEALDALIAVDISTGARSELVSRKVGTGTALIAPRSFALSADGMRAYVGDDGLNAPARLFEVDLATGDRQVIGDISQPFNYPVTGLALDETGSRVFVSFHHIILQVNLETADVQTVVSTDTTDLESISDLVLDIDNDRLLVGDSSNDGIFAVDLTTHAVELVSQEAVKGDGPAFGGVVSLTRVAATSELYVAGQPSGDVMRVNPETGDREVLASNCNLGLAFDNLVQVLYNEALDELIISGDKLFSLDLETGNCAILKSKVPLLQIQFTPANQLLAVTLGAMLQLDRETGEVVIVSK